MNTGSGVGINGKRCGYKGRCKLFLLLTRLRYDRSQNASAYQTPWKDLVCWCVGMHLLWVIPRRGLLICPNYFSQPGVRGRGWQTVERLPPIDYQSTASHKTGISCRESPLDEWKCHSVILRPLTTVVWCCFVYLVNITWFLVFFCLPAMCSASFSPLQKEYSRPFSEVRKTKKADGTSLLRNISFVNNQHQNIVYHVTWNQGIITLAAGQ